LKIGLALNFKTAVAIQFMFAKLLLLQANGLDVLEPKANNTESLDLGKTCYITWFPCDSMALVLEVVKLYVKQFI